MSIVDQLTDDVVRDVGIALDLLERGIPMSQMPMEVRHSIKEFMSLTGKEASHEADGATPQDTSAK
jgi:hypothetical protein